MTAFDRIERRLPELIDEITTASIPDYFDDMLQRTSQARQRPAWSTLERWLPMGVIARPLPLRPMPWRLIVIIAAIGLLAAATLAYVGSRPRILPPFGPAANGSLIIGSADGHIVSLDPVTGTSTTLINGPAGDGGPYFSNDGRRFVFERGAFRAPAGAIPALYIANADGSDVHELFPAGTDIGAFEWAPDGERAVITPTVNGKGTISIVDIANGRSTGLALDLDVIAASWRPNHDQLVVTAKAGDNSTYWVVDVDGSGQPRQIPVSEYAINEPTLSPDGTSFAYATWEPVPGPIRVVGIDTGGDRPLATTDVYHFYLWQGPQFSPDGTKLLVHRFAQGTTSSQLVVIAVDGDGSETTAGPTTENPQPEAAFSPDGTKILATYPTTTTTWLFDADGRNERQMPLTAIAGASWQRRAP